jgi:N-hydroxyarylamine O-acetyltransferase
MTSVPSALDLDAYFERVARKGPSSPTYGTLASLLRAHMDAIPFENLDVLLGRSIRLDLESLQAKLVTARRGGYCFEQATLLAAVLERIGFTPVAHTARVTLHAPLSQAGRTHMFLTVALHEGTFVIDPGFGVLAPRVPVPLVDGAVVRFGAEEHGVVRDGAWWILRAKRDGAWVNGWATTLGPEFPVDFEMGSHFTSTHASSPFRSLLMMRMLTPQGRVTVMNRAVTIVRDGHAETRRLADRAELRALLARTFGFDLPEVEQLKVPAEPEWA